MTERLAYALRETADAAPAYDVLDAAIRVGRRRRIRNRVGSGTAVLAVLMVAKWVRVRLQLRNARDEDEPPGPLSAGGTGRT